MSDLPPGTKSDCQYTYEGGLLLIRPECAHERAKDGEAANAGKAGKTDEAGSGSDVRDCNGAVLEDGNSVVVIKDLKVKGSSSTVKIGTKVKNIRLVEGDHNIDCGITGIGAIKLKSEFVRKTD